MKKYIILVMTMILVFTFLKPVQAKAANDAPQVIVLSTTNEMKDGYPVLEERIGSEKLVQLINNSFIKKSLDIYKEAFKYTKLNDESFYLSFKPDSGAYGRIGFYLKKQGLLIDKTSIPYIEMNEKELTYDQGRLQSMTQIFPHEMGHILLGLMSPKLNSPSSNNLDIHYSNVVTQYSTAFSEGFAEHFEIIARKHEKNVELKKSINDDIAMKEKRIIPTLSRVKKDFILPLRLDYYRGTSIFWFQQAEALKREQLPISGDCIYKNSYSKFSNIEKTLLLRNTGLAQDLQHKRSLQQSLSVESVISRFFVLLESNNKLSLVDFYSQIMNVFRKYVGKNEVSPLIEFVNGYCLEYPEQKDAIYKYFKAATGYEFTDKIAPEIWLVVESNHIITAMDQFGAMKVPLYIFNINTSEVEDLLKLGIKVSEAEKIIQFRDKKGYLLDMEELKKIDGIQSETLSAFDKASLKTGWTQQKLDRLLYRTDGNMGLSINNMMTSYLIHLLVRSVILFVIFFAVYYLLVLKVKKVFIKLTIKQFLKFILYVMLGLFSSLVSVNVIVRNMSVHPVLMFGIIIIIMEGIKLIIIRKNIIKFKDSLISTLIMTTLIMYSLI